MAKIAVLSMDIEDWHHLDYFRDSLRFSGESMLDGLSEYLSLLEAHRVTSTFFVLGELAEQLAPSLRALIQRGHEIASHGMHHKRPLTMSPAEFETDLADSKRAIERASQTDVLGFRAPCFSLDRPRLEQVHAAGYMYDSSRIDFASHPLYGTLDLHGFERVGDSHFRRGDFHEFEVSTFPICGKPIPVSGGGYLRILPWAIMGQLVSAYTQRHDLYVLYIHPFELSKAKLPLETATAPFLRRVRFAYGRQTVATKLNRLIGLLRKRGFEFKTFADLCRPEGWAS